MVTLAFASETLGQGSNMGRMATVVAFHAHPDDEVLITMALAWAAAQGHRAVGECFRPAL